MTCSQPAAPAFTSISPIQSGYIYLSVLTYTCDLGYNRTSGDETRTCDENAHWTGNEANCTCKYTCIVLGFLSKSVYKGKVRVVMLPMGFAME